MASASFQPCAPWTLGARMHALASAEKAISSAASFVLPGLKAAFVAYTEARHAEDAGDLAAAIEKYGVRHEPADDHEARALEAAALSPSETARFHHRARALRPAVFLHLNLGGPMALSRVQFGRAVASAAALDADLVRGALRPAGTAPLSVALDSSSFVEALGVPLVPLDLALREAFSSST